MPGITLDVNSLVTMANRAMQTDPQRSIIVKDGGFREVGKLGAFFARKSECRMVGQALLQSLRQTYGDEVADATAQDLRGVMDKGKPLTARMIKDAIDNAETLSEAIRRHNTLTRLTFFAGSGGQKDFEAAIRHYCSIFNHDPNDPDLRLYARDAVLNALKDSQKSLTADDFYDAVISLHPVLTNNTLTAARSARETADLVDTLAVWNGMTGAQRKEILLSVNKAIMQAVQNPREFVSQQSLRTLANNVACLKIFELSGKIDEVAGELAAKYSYGGRDLREAFRAHVSWDLSRLLENAPAQTKEELSLDSLKKSFTDAKTHHLQEFLRKHSAPDPDLEARRKQALVMDGVLSTEDYSFAQLHSARVEDTATAKDWYAPKPEPAEQPAVGMSGDDCRDRNQVTAHAVQWKIRINAGVLANVCQLKRMQRQELEGEVNRAMMEMAEETGRIHTKNSMITYASNIAVINAFQLSGMKDLAVDTLAGRYGMNLQQQHWLMKAVSQDLDRLAETQGGKDTKNFGQPSQLSLDSLYNDIIGERLPSTGAFLRQFFPASAAAAPSAPSSDASAAPAAGGAQKA